MIGTVFVLIAGWHRHKFAAVVIVLASFALQAMIAPPVMVTRRLSMLPPSAAGYAAVLAWTAAKVLLAGVLFYVVGSGLRALHDKWKEWTRTT